MGRKPVSKVSVKPNYHWYYGYAKGHPALYVMLCAYVNVHLQSASFMNVRCECPPAPSTSGARRVAQPRTHARTHARD